MIERRHQQRASVTIASGDGHGRPPKPEIDGRQVHSHLCTTRAGARVRTFIRWGAAREAVVQQFNWVITVGIVAPVVAPVQSVTEPEPPIRIVAPALDGRVVLRREASEHN